MNFELILKTLPFSSWYIAARGLYWNKLTNSSWLLCRASWAAPSGSVGHRCSKWHSAPDWILGHLGLRAWPNGLQSIWGTQSALCSWAPQLLAYFSWMRSEASPTKIQLQQHLPNVSCPCATRTRYSSSEINWWLLGSCSYWSQLFWWIKSLAGWGSEPTCFHLSLQRVFSLRIVIFLLVCTRRTARLQQRHQPHRQLLELAHLVSFRSTWRCYHDQSLDLLLAHLQHHHGLGPPQS